MARVLDIDIERASQSRLGELDEDKLVFGRQFSDHMLCIDYANGEWGVPRIVPFGSIQMHPSSVVLHYGQSIFEGLKAFRQPSGQIAMFRPEMHARRLNVSAERLCMPTLPEETFLESLEALLEVDSAWIPKKPGNSLYVRPFMIATDIHLGVAPSKSYSFFIITSPVASYYAGAVKVRVETKYVRACRGGIGNVKTGGNYAASLLPTLNAQKAGYEQILWTDSVEHKHFEEAGTMNVMFEIDGRIVTPSTDNSSILEGVTRQSVKELAAHWGVPFEERDISVEEVIAAHEVGKLNDAFGTGTAATISPISTINFGGKDYDLPPVEKRGFSQRALQYLSDVKMGLVADELGWMVPLQ